jgi:energy-coupling factor transport system ATP-binding protein
MALGAALAGRPQLVVLDEPTSQLDPVAGDELIGLLRRCNEDFDTAILISEHRLERCLAAADRVIALRDGRVACDAAPDEFLAWAGGEAPVLQTPGARLLRQIGLAPVPGVKRARAALRDGGQLPDRRQSNVSEAEPAASADRRLRRRSAAALEFDGVWHELRAGPVILRDVNLRVAPGERVALMGRNGAGKSTLLRHAAGLIAPTRGRVVRGGRVALLLQNPNDYLVHERVELEAPAVALRQAGLDPAAFAGRHPRELSGGERQRLALAVVLGQDDDETAPEAVCLDEPTRGMDREHKEQLAALVRGMPAAVLVATHDPEFVAAFADRVVLLGDGVVIADGPVRQVLAGGSYFATETARILGGFAGALTPEDGVAALTRRTPDEHGALV